MPSKPMAVQSFSNHIWHNADGKPGAGIAKLRRTHGHFLKPLVYSLLKGRPLIIHAPSEMEAYVLWRAVAFAVALTRSARRMTQYCAEHYDDAVDVCAGPFIDKHCTHFWPMSLLIRSLTFDSF